MGSCLTTPETDSDIASEIHSNNQIDKIMKKEKLKDAKVRKLLLLGAGAAGKSTLIKQMKYVFAQNRGFPESDQEHYSNVVYWNLVQIIHVLCKQCKLLNIKISSKEILNDIEQLLLLEEPIIFRERDKWPKNLTFLMKESWKCKDSPLQYLFNNKTNYKFNIMDNSDYFLKSFDDIISEDYTPSFEDVVRTRSATTGIVSEYFEVEKNGESLEYCIYDVGGQRSERRKWVQLFEDCSAIIYVMALSGYDQVLYEDNTANRFIEALTLFSEIISHKSFKKVPFIIFLNKYDIFCKKLDLDKIPFMINLYINKYSSNNENNDYLTNKKLILEFVTDELTSRDQRPVYERLQYHHVTTATDTGNVEKVFYDVHNIIVKGTMRKVNLI